MPLDCIPAAVVWEGKEGEEEEELDLEEVVQKLDLEVVVVQVEVEGMHHVGRRRSPEC